MEGCEQSCPIHKYWTSVTRFLQVWVPHAKVTSSFLYNDRQQMPNNSRCNSLSVHCWTARLAQNLRAFKLVSPSQKSNWYQAEAEPKFAFNSYWFQLVNFLEIQIYPRFSPILIRPNSKISAIESAFPKRFQLDMLQMIQWGCTWKQISKLVQQVWKFIRNIEAKN